MERLYLSEVKFVKHFLFVVVLLQGLTVEQFAKIPQLYTHFVEHNEIKEMSFAHFLVHHYLEQDHDDDDDEQDMALPFKNAVHSCFHFFEDARVELSLDFAIEPIDKDHFGSAESYYPTPVFDIPHPPANSIL